MKNFLVTFCTILTCFSLKAQPDYTPEELFSEGQYFYQRDDFKEALFFYKSLLDKFPDNAHFNFKVGECYLNIAGQEHLAVPYLEKAVQKVVPKKQFRERNFNEANAPLHAMYYLGNAYRAAGRLTEALEQYKGFLDSPYFFGNYNFEVVETEINSCERAVIIQDSPIKYTKTKLNDNINTELSEFSPVMSADGQTLVFVRELKFYNAVFMSKKTSNGWGGAVNITQEIISDGNFYPTGLNSSGTVMLLVKQENDNSDIYISYYKDSRWGPAEKIAGKINTLAMETFASFGAGDKTIYFTSNRTGSKGKGDIYQSAMNPDSTWGKAKNLGKTINTKLDEETPVVCNNGKTLFFSSKGHDNMGGYDIFYTHYNNKKWSVPRNLGYPINTTRDNLFYISGPGCLTAIMSMVDTETGISDIYEITIGEPLVIP
ncbi:MAG: PD40 domain-containing protein [Bacteroidales bacterium]|nr:PD40 domain-containing protein [Bacteroidales bacterium]